jgi:phosphoglycolate phosphatase
VHVLIDLDGTLLDPSAGLIASIQHALKQLGRPVPPATDLTWMIGPPLRVSFAQLLGGTEETEAAVAHYRAYYGARGMYEAAVYAGIPEALEALRAAGCHLIVATAKPHHFARPILEHFALAHRFDAIHGPELDGTRDAKADLIAFILAEERIAVDAALMVGDRALDISAASSNGLPSIAAAWGYGTPAELSAAGPAAICETPQELARLVLDTLARPAAWPEGRRLP